MGTKGTHMGIYLKKDAKLGMRRKHIREMGHAHALRMRGKHNAVIIVIIILIIIDIIITITIIMSQNAHDQIEMVDVSKI